MKRYRIYRGYASNGRNRWVYFDSLQEANVAAERIRRQTGVFVEITEVNK